MSTVRVALVSSRQTLAAARVTARSARSVLADSPIAVLDLDGSYAPVGDEAVLTVADLGLDPRDVHLMTAALPTDRVVHHLRGALARRLLEQDPTSTLLSVAAGVLLIRAPTDIVEGARAEGLCLVHRAGPLLPDDGRWPTASDVAAAGRFSSGLLGVTAGHPFLTAWDDASPSTGDVWLDAAAARLPHQMVPDVAALLSAWNLDRDQRIEGDGDLTIDGRPVGALDLSSLDPRRPWMLAPDVATEPRGRLSDHPVLAELVRRTSAEMSAESLPATDRPESWDMTTTSLGTPVDAPLRELYRSAAAAAAPAGQAPPDPFDAGSADQLLEWLTAPGRGGVGRYLRALHGTRADLQRAFPRFPGKDTPDFLRWVQLHGRQEDYPTELLDAALRRVTVARSAPHERPPRRPPRRRAAHGVAVIGYLRGELGIGESARLMVTALRAAGIPHAAVSIDQRLVSRQRPTDGPKPSVRTGQGFDTSLICVNADLTPAVAAAIPDLVARSYRIGMWYWEVEDFPASQHGGFDHVDEVWVATDFVRRAVEPHSPVPVRVVTPPLPQRGAEPTLTRTDLGLPDRPLFLFSFDFLSTAERKNPWGLIDAFRQAFAPDEGPVLVIKSINAELRPEQAERLRLAAAAHPDVLLLEQYLDAADRDALMALCDCYVSLHRSEGLGLTMAEAMAWGKPVIATGYSGNLQFMTEENSFLVPWTPVAIPAGAEPYPPGGTWADPDLPAAAAAMRLVMERSDVAAARGARAAADIATLHSPEVAGAEIAARLAQITETRRGRRPPGLDVPSWLRALARRVRRAVR